MIEKNQQGQKGWEKEGTDVTKGMFCQNEDMNSVQKKQKHINCQQQNTYPDHD